MKHTPISLASDTPNPSAFADPDEVTAALNAIMLVTETRSSSPILANVRLTGDTKQLDFTGTDLDMMISVAIPARSTEIFDITVPAALLRDIARSANDSIRRVRLQMIPDPAEKRVALDREGNEIVDDDGFPVMEDVPTNRPFYSKLHARFGDAEYDIQALPADDFPALADLDEDAWSFTVPGSPFFNALDQTIPGMSSEETRYYLNGVFLHVPEKGILAATTTDGHRLFRQVIGKVAGLYRSMKGVRGKAVMPGVIVPRKAVMVLHRLMAGRPPLDVHLIVSDGHLQAAWDNIVVRTKLVDGSYPDYARVIPTGNDKTATIDVVKLASAIKQVSAIASERGKAVKLSFSMGEVVLAVNNPDTGAARRVVRCSYDGDPLEVGVNGTYLLDMIGRAAPDKTDITMHMADAATPILITGSISGWSGVQMPMRV